MKVGVIDTPQPPTTPPVRLDGARSMTIRLCLWSRNELFENARAWSSSGPEHFRTDRSTNTDVRGTKDTKHCLRCRSDRSVQVKARTHFVGSL